MENRLEGCAESLREVEKKLQADLAASTDPAEHGHISEALSFVAKAIDAVTHVREKIGHLPKSQRTMN
jgi:hypothetical protein